MGACKAHVASITFVRRTVVLSYEGQRGREPKQAAFTHDINVSGKQLAEGAVLA